MASPLRKCAGNGAAGSNPALSANQTNFYMKKLICALLLALSLSAPVLAASYKASVKGEVFVKAEDEMIPLKEEDSVSDEDVIIIIEEKSSITFFVNGTKIVIRKPGTYKVADIVKKV